MAIQNALFVVKTAFSFQFHKQTHYGPLLNKNAFQ